MADKDKDKADVGGVGGPSVGAGAGGPATPSKKSDPDVGDPDAPPDAPAKSAKPVGFSFHGQGGGAFSIYGPGLGTSGSVTVDGKPVAVTSWNDTRVKGTLPDGVNDNAEVVVTSSTGDKYKEAKDSRERRAGALAAKKDDGGGDSVLTPPAVDPGVGGQQMRR